MVPRNIDVPTVVVERRGVDGSLFVLYYDHLILSGILSNVPSQDGSDWSAAADDGPLAPSDTIGEGCA